MPMKPTDILSFGLILADQIPEGRMNGALATAVDWRKRRREREWDFMRGSLPKPSPLKSIFLKMRPEKDPVHPALENIDQAAYAPLRRLKHHLLTTTAAVLLVGCGRSRRASSFTRT